MSLQFIRGTAEMDLEEALIQASVQWLSEEDSHEVFYLVPNHMKFEQEINALKRIKYIQKNQNDSIATMRFQVFSFYRLAWYFLQHTQYYGSEILSEAGAAMVFRKILSENEEALKVFRGEVNKSGFIQQLFDLYQEMKEGNIDLDELFGHFSGQQTDSKEQDLQLKIQDIKLVFSKFEETMSQYGIKSAEIINYLTEYLETKDLRNVLFVINGYHNFSARELKLIETLMRRGGEVKISLVLDKKYPNELPSLMNLFYETGTTYHKLYQLARNANVAILPDHVEKNKKLIADNSIQTLEKYWIEAQESHPKRGKQRINDDHLQFWCAENPKEEINHIAKEIRRLVVEENYRYKDIQLLTRELDSYETMIEPLFSMNEIPVYLDRDMAMEQHPLVEFIQSLFAIHAYHYRYRDVLRFLRTELFFPIEDQISVEEWQVQRNEWRRKIDVAENVVLAYGYEGYHWEKNKDWHFIRYDFEAEQQDDTELIEKDSNTVRKMIQQNVPAFFKTIQKAQTGVEAADFFYRFLVNNGVEKQLMMWRNQAIEMGQLEQARNHEQTWEALMTLLDEYVTIYGNDSFDLAAFEEIFSSGLEGLRYNKVPTAIDQVQVRSIDLARPGQAKVVFAIGLTDQVLPQKFDNKTLLSDEERQFVNDQLDDGQFLLNDTRKSIAKEPFNAYIMFAAATERLYFSYPSVKDTAKDVKVSTYLTNIQNDLGLQMQQRNALTILDDEQVSLEHIGTYRTLISDLTNLKRQKKEMQEGILAFWLTLERQLMKHSQAALASHVFESLGHRNLPENLQEHLADELYTKHIYTSVSRMESFYRCQYQYFSRFGLGLKERDVFGLSPAATGDFFHEALDQFFKLLIMQNKQLSELTDREVSEFTEQILNTVFGEIKFSILDTSSRMNYIRYQLGQTIKKVSWALKRQSERSGMTTVQTEVLFGQIASQKGIKGLELPLKNGGNISVRGKIDRLDQLVTPDSLYLGVVDYKSSHKKFNITEAYYGLAMQMLTYLDVALMDAVNLVGQSAKPAGSFYLHVHNPILPYETEDKKEQQLLKKFQFDGLLLNDPVLLENLDKSLQAKQSSLIFPIEESAKEIIKPGRRQEDKFVTEPELGALLTHNRSKFIEAGNKVTSGEIELNPAYQGKERIACRFCPFRSVCNFDVMLKENNYNRIETLSKKDVMDRLIENEQEGGTNDE
ncbi:helicase-exonuclease AddAB, AddB subunit [Enterococcus haemoperoxidus ATCC BAA-382]|uniref:ATP-dependent helicase/deoxyribonuclease subunit B n=1 Tax=Enterococcus haemoperoxidus ATCC BAA-382 TaxID=1158608 RepID=R2T099_9ENTE|nr:PD-(D/E)XK nuclease family protein [Enterococcus haemoperoxidus]EOH98456.1 helicase-exonuclease AddAB, AddB subunit [Enterococcus haemoperoxidus ATCC BAA-382]EOT62361.1 helicase-exonuclease AddAB, AddB subunit [Enterococcus haemoperoxidus ATCC BAA-382]OJG55557.1 helicase-exonuclease AddAB, AddB subunit [Enterococcus haemoperoxidus]